MIYLLFTGDTHKIILNIPTHTGVVRPGRGAEHRPNKILQPHLQASLWRHKRNEAAQAGGGRESSGGLPGSHDEQEEKTSLLFVLLLIFVLKAMFGNVSRFWLEVKFKFALLMLLLQAILFKS